MDDMFQQSNQPVNPRRKKRTKMQIFKETYLPAIIVGIALLLILIFIIGSITRAVQKKRYLRNQQQSQASAVDEGKLKLDQEANELLRLAEEYAANYDYANAIAVLESFSGDLIEYSDLNDQIIAYETVQKSMVEWNDPSQIVNLSFQMLVADPNRSFNYPTYGSSINKNFVTTEEFSKILQQLYNNGYVLVDFDDFIEETVAADNTVSYKTKSLYLPKGKKPLMLTQTNVNYNYYLIDSDGDSIPDGRGGGFASKLLWDGTKFTCEMVDSTGKTVTGAYDMVPILESFIKANPSFSYRGARATLALTGYNGLLGYRTHASAAATFGDAAYRQANQDATTVANALRKAGYTLACYTYANIPYGDSSINQIKNDLNSWTNEVTPITGNLNILAYAQGSDITKDEIYSGDKYNTLQNIGFRYYLGFCNDGKPWAFVTNEYVRMGRIMVTGSNMAHNADWFANMFDAASVLDSTRGNVPK